MNGKNRLRKAKDSVTPKGVSTLLQRFPPSENPLILRATRSSFSEVFILSDDKEEVEAIFLPHARQQLAEAISVSQFLIEVQGIVESFVSRGIDRPLVLIADLRLLSTIKKEEPHTRILWKVPNRNKKIPGGKAPIFFRNWAPFLSNEELAGYEAWNRTFFPQNPVLRHNDKVSSFLEHHGAIRTLHRSGRSSDDASVTMSHLSAIKEFGESQLDRQKASLTSNAGRETAENATKVVEQYNKALERALGYTTGDLTVDCLCEWHGILCGQGLREDAGQLRRKKVHVGATSFQPPQRVRGDLDSICKSIRTLEARLLQNAVAGARRGVNVATFAAAVFFGIVDVHAFSDGNGRLARIALNWALKRAGVPFVIHLFATTNQRAEYVSALKQTRRNISLVSRGEVTHDQLLEAYRTAGALLPLVQLFLARLERTIVEFERLAVEKSSQQSQDAQARAARLYRERAAQGNCLICFEDSPNIATLCCGKAVHLNCMAEWLSQRNSCPQCRNEMPSLPARMRAARPEAEAPDYETSSLFSNSSTTMSTTDLDVEDSDDGTTGDETEDDIPPLSPAYYEETSEDDSISFTSLTGDVQPDPPSAPDEATSMDETESSVYDLEGMETTSTSSVPLPSSVRQQPPPPVCTFVNCHNKSARDCENMACGRCCQTYGFYSCARHNIS